MQDALWPDTTATRPYSALYATLSQIRAVTRTITGLGGPAVIRHRRHRLALDPDGVDVDYWDFLRTEQRRRAALTDDDRLVELRRLADLHRADLAAELSWSWLDAPREHARRTVLDALAALAVHHRERQERDHHLAVLEQARTLDPINDAVYRDILRTQAALGLTEAIPRTITLLTTALDVHGLTPDPGTLDLARRLIGGQPRLEAALLSKPSRKS